ncbi:MAG: hypothetical protein AAGE01_06305 [Pseudomonadota bacterium]
MHRRNFIAAALAATFAPNLLAREPIVGGRCQGCEQAFAGMPEALSERARIGAADENGEPMTVTGAVRDAAGQPAPGIIVYAYQTDSGGIYPKAATARGGLRAWVRTDMAGRYRFDTIRPGAYPGRQVPQHIHMHVIEPGLATYYLASIEFEDDPLLMDHHRRRHTSGRGGSGLAMPRRDDDGRWHVERDITLRLNLD